MGHQPVMAQPHLPRHREIPGFVHRKQRPRAHTPQCRAKRENRGKKERPKGPHFLRVNLSHVEIGVVACPFCSKNAPSRSPAPTADGSDPSHPTRLRCLRRAQLPSAAGCVRALRCLTSMIGICVEAPTFGFAPKQPDAGVLPCPGHAPGRQPRSPSVRPWKGPRARPSLCGPRRPGRPGPGRSTPFHKSWALGHRTPTCG